MLRLTDVHYTAIGRVTVESFTLDRELAEYLTNLGSPPRPKSGIGRKLADFKSLLGAQGLQQAPILEFHEAIRLTRALVDRRNALAHGVWIPDPNSSSISSTAIDGAVSVRAAEVADIAAKIKLARKLILRLCQDHLPLAAAGKKPISATPTKLLSQL
jgi:hypothetical protein